MKVLLIVLESLGTLLKVGAMYGDGKENPFLVEFEKMSGVQKLEELQSH